MGAATWLGVAVVVLVVAIVLVVAVVLVRALRRGRPTPVAEPDRDAWEEALLASTPDAPAVPGYPTGQASAYPPPATPPVTPAQEILSRDALLDRDLRFDPTGWDDDPDGHEGTDFGLVGGGKG